MVTQEVASAVVIDSVPLCRDGFVRMLHEDLGLRVLASATCLRDAVRIAQTERPDLVILDRDAVDGDAFAVAGSIRFLLPAVRVVLTGLQFTADDVEQADRLGVDACLLKSAEPGELELALQSLVQRPARRTAPIEVYPRRVRSTRFEGDRRPALDELTQREIDVLCHVARGRTVVQTARLLGLSPKTVDTHKTNVMAKLRIHDRVVLARFAICEGLVPIWDE